MYAKEQLQQPCDRQPVRFRHQVADRSVGWLGKELMAGDMSVKDGIVYGDQVARIKVKNTSVEPWLDLGY